jgi:hypothetical protein
VKGKVELIEWSCRREEDRQGVKLVEKEAGLYLS